MTIGSASQLAQPNVNRSLEPKICIERKDTDLYGCVQSWNQQNMFNDKQLY